ncbi:MAG: hypothetical protein U1C12_01005 [Patescibacteria group bacterium]|nr:hypothetical protein [Patescibacteria group bacterium]
MNNQHHKEIIDKLNDLCQRMDKVENKLAPIYDMFKSAQGFNKISIWMLKGLAMIGSAILGIYVMIEFIKKIGR